MTRTVDRRELFSKAAAGLIAGAVGWVPVELVSHGHSLTQAETTSTIVGGFVTMGLVAGLIGGAILAVEGGTFSLTPGMKRRFWRGFIVCLVLSIPATFLSDVAFGSILAAGGWGVSQAGSIIYLVLARLTGWTLMGAMLGVGVGVAGFSLRNTLKGLVGGAIGGFAGGLVFDLVGSISQTGLLSRLIGFCAIGLAIGLFIGLVQELTKAAWLVVEAGRVRGRQFRLEGARVTLGRAEENSVGLFGDPGVQPRHAVIERQVADYTLRNLAVQEGTFINGGRVESATLHDGDRIKLSNYELSFHLRATAAARDSHAPDSGRAGPPDRVERSPTAFPAAPRAVAAGEARLATLAGESFPVRAGALTRMGRALDNDIVLGHASISRHHAAIEPVNGGWRLRDLGSQNGTFIGGERIADGVLIHNGARVRLGDLELTFHA